MIPNSDRAVHGIRVVFGSPWTEVIADVVSGERVGVVCSQGRRELADQVGERLPRADVVVVPLARRHVPRPIVDRAAELLEAHRADSLVAVGGGSAIGLAKAVQFSARRPLVALPTTYSGSEMTNIFGVREGGTKRVGRDERVRPDAVIYDPALTLELPLSLSLPSLFNAMAHAVDALYVEPSDETIDSASESIRALATAIAELADSPRDLGARRRAMWGAHLAGALLSHARMALHHKLAHVVGGSFDLPHAPTHTVLLPHTIAFNAPAAPDATRVIADALGTDDPAGFVYDLAARVGAPTDLAGLGFADADVAAAADQLVAASYDNPRKPDRPEAVALLGRARSGERPRPDDR